MGRIVAQTVLKTSIKPRATAPFDARRHVCRFLHLDLPEARFVLPCGDHWHVWTMRHYRAAAA